MYKNINQNDFANCLHGNCSIIYFQDIFNPNYYFTNSTNCITQYIAKPNRFKQEFVYIGSVSSAKDKSFSGPYIYLPLDPITV